jgi:hypothetical protein
MTKRNEKSTDFHEFFTLRRSRERRAVRVNRFNRFDFNRFCHSSKASQNQDKQFQSRDDHEKSIKLQQQESSEERDQCEKHVKNSEELVQLVRVKNVIRFIN